MPDTEWMIYGAYGFTGALIAREAVARGHRPTLAGRNAEKLRAIADELDLPRSPLSLSDREGLIKTLSSHKFVVHAAGPYMETSAPMVEACLAAGTHYVDIAGELSVFTAIYKRHGEALRRGVALIPGCGFDVIPSDSLAARLAERLPNATHLELALDSVTRLSRGTANAAMEVIAGGGFVRRDGRIQARPIGERGPNVRFHGGERQTIIAPFADLESAYRTAGIPNITTSLALPPGLAWITHFAPIAHTLLGIAPIRHLVQKGISLLLGRRKAQTEGYASIWGRASNAEGESVEGWMRTIEPYHYTATAVVNVIERLAEEQCAGALTPASLFGTDFALSVAGTERYDRFPI